MIRKTSVVVAALIIAASLLTFACSRKNNEAIGQSSARLLSPENDAGFGITAIGQPLQEPSSS